MSGYLLEGHRAMGVVQFYAGEFPAARQHLDRGVALYDVQAHRAHALRYEDDPGMTCLDYAARTLWTLGYVDQAVQLGDRAIEVARATAHTPSIAEALTWRAEIALVRREACEVEERSMAALAPAIENGLPLWIGIATTLHGWALGAQGQNAEGLARMREGLAVMARTGDRLLRHYYLAWLAEALGRADQTEEAHSALEQAIEGYRGSGAAYWDAELLRLRGELLLARNPSDAAAGEACFRQAIKVAQAQSAKSLELRAATSLARLWRDQGPALYS